MKTQIEKLLNNQRFTSDIDSNLLKYEKQSTLSNVYRGMTIDRLPEVNELIDIQKYGLSYSYKFNVAWDFALAAESYSDQNIKVIFNVDTMKHIDLKTAALESDIEELYKVMIEEEDEIVCTDNSLYKVTYINKHKRLLSTIYEIGLRKDV